tara:strand:- start:1095 stop:1955 length:861 start_codon:yes stop_codon:yes gene_type:complete
MFRKGGSAEGGITSGLQAPRQGYATGKLAKVQSELALLNQLAPAPVRPQSTAMNDFLINFGLDMTSRSPTGNIFQTAAAAAKDPFAQFQKQKLTEQAMDANAMSDQRATVAALMKGIDDDDKNKLYAEAQYMVEKGATNPFTNEPFKDVNEAYDVLIRKNLMSKESLKTDTAIYNETLETLFNQNLKDVNFKGNNLAARKLAEHEANVIHGKYPKNLSEQFDTQTTYIDSVYVEVDADGNMKLNNIGKKVGYRPNKIYFNIADGAFYKLEADKETFTVVDIADFAD